MNDILNFKTVVEFCAIECEKQRSGERSVAHMVNGWSYCWDKRNETPPTNEFIQLLGWLVEPRTNRVGVYRKTRVGVQDRDGWHPKAEPDQVPRLMDLLIGSWSELSAEEWYFEYEEIHPFGDGNGRTGNLLYNLHRGSLESTRLVYPPNFWSDHPHATEMAKWNEESI